MYKRQLQCNSSYVLFYATYKLDTWNVTELLYRIAKGIVVFQYIFCFCWQSSCTFEQEHVFQPGKSYCISALQSWPYSVWSFRKNACDDNIMPVMRRCRKLCGSGCGGRRATFTGHEYLLLFICGGSLSTKMETTLKISCAVNFCGIFTCPTSKKITLS